MSKTVSKIDSWNSGLSAREKVGGSVALVGAGGAGLMFLAAILPFITFPMLLVIAFVGGLVMML